MRFSASFFIQELSSTGVDGFNCEVPDATVSFFDTRYKDVFWNSPVAKDDDFFWILEFYGTENS